MKVMVRQGLPAASSLALDTFTDEAPAGAVRIAFMNLMPEKVPAERDVLRMLRGGAALIDDSRPIAVDLKQPASHKCLHTDQKHLAEFYTTLSTQDLGRYSAMIINGAPLERVDYEDVDYFGELSELADEACRRGIPVLYICWGAFFGIYRRFGIDKHLVPAKLSGVYRHHKCRVHPLTEGLDSMVYLPHSRHCLLDGTLQHRGDAAVLLRSEDGPGDVLSVSLTRPEVYITAHPEYDTMTLDNEYCRDSARGLNPNLPDNYYRNNRREDGPVNLWAAPAARITANWIRHYILNKAQ